MRKYIVLAAASLVPVLAIAGYAAASERSEAAGVAAATARFHDLDVAKAENYTVHVQELSGATCIDNGADGAMGDHFGKGAEIVDGDIDAAEPELLVYEQRRNGTFKLVALEYLVFKADWEEAGNTSPPSLFGRQFDLTGTPNRYGLPPFYALHAWIWKPNPSGVFAPYNPSVSCD